jgi:DNA repair protein RadC
MIPYLLAVVGGYLIGTSTKEVFEEGGVMAKGGVTYKDLSTLKPEVVNDSDVAERTKRIKEVEIVKTGSVKLVEGSDKPITSSRDAYLIFKDFWSESQINVAEHFNVMLLSKSNKPIGLYQHSKGGIDGTIADIEMISAMAVKSLAKGVIVAHNHPSDNTKPSQADLNVVKRLKEALSLFQINLLDSLIVTPNNSYLSFADEGLI